MLTKKLRRRRKLSDAEIKRIARKYKTRGQFAEMDGATYKQAQISGKLDYFCSHMNPVLRTWTEDLIRKEALKFKTRSQFMREADGAAGAAKRMGIYEDICRHMRPPQRKYLRAEVLLEAMKYKKKIDFRKNAPGFEQAARRLGIFEQATKHMAPSGHKYLRKIYSIEFDDKSVYIGLSYDPEKRLEDHKKRTNNLKKRLRVGRYKFVVSKELFSRSRAPLEEAKKINHYRKKGWTVLNLKKAGSLGAVERTWTKEKIIQIAKTCKTVKDFRESHPLAAAAARRNGIERQVTRHMKRQFAPFTKIKIKELARECKYKMEFVRKYPSAYNAARRLQIVNSIGAHWNKPESRRYWTKSRLQQEAKKYRTRKEFSVKNQSAYQAARKLNVLDVICRHMKLQQMNWDQKKIMLVAKQYDTKQEFYKKALPAYAAAYRLGILDAACKHMSPPIRKKIWTAERVFKEAKKYKRRSDFMYEGRGGYNAARSLGILDEACSHMVRRGG